MKIEDYINIVILESNLKRVIKVSWDETET